ncbi:MAG: 50S ribosomal protein L24 [Candidatus Marinimicrobia bacterium]|nr:50S ribosomal protein L24 [Candidatus Neomarinimicrobiota bacterium]
MNIKKGMTVKVISGNHRGSEGKVLHVFPKRERIIVEGINFIKRHTRPSQANPQGGIVEREGALHVSNVMVIHRGGTTRIGHKKLDDGSKVRIATKTGEEIV